MVRRSLGVALWSLVGLLASFLGALSALVGTAAGRTLLVRTVEHALRYVVAGTVEVGDLRGPLLTGITFSEVKLFDADTTLVAWLPRAELSYNPFDFAAGRVVLLEVTLRRPLFNVVQHANGKLNLEELLRLGGPDTGGPHGPAPLVLFRNVRIEAGSVVLRLQDQVSPDDSAHEIDRFGRDGRRRVRRFDDLNAHLAALRLSSPREKGIRADVVRLAVVSTDPAFQLVDLAGRITIRGDSLDADLTRVRMPASQLAARGRVRWPLGPLRYDLDLRADSVTLGDVRFIDPRFPARAVLRGEVALRSRPRGRDVLEVRLDPMDLTYGRAGGTLTGRLTALSDPDSGLIALRQADLTASDLDLELARPFLDTLPFAGRLTGHTVAEGALSGLAAEVDWSFRDSLAAGWPETRIRGKGEVNLTGADGIRFQPFSVEAATVDLGTVRRLVPGFGLRGVLEATGTLTGPLTNAQFDGTLRHHDGAGPASVVRGGVRLDGRGDTLGLFADVVADSLSFEGLRSSFPALALRGTVAGPIKVQGTLAALETHLALAAPEAGGSLAGDGVLLLAAPRFGARGLTLHARDLDLRRWIEGAPTSRLTLTVVGTVQVDSATPPAGAVRATLGPSLLAGTILDTGAMVLRFADRRLYVDSLRLAQPGLITTGSGSLGWARPARGILSLDFDADSLSPLDPLVNWLAGAGTAGGKAGGGLTGAARALLTLAGSLDSLTAEVRVNAQKLGWRDWAVPAGRAHAAYRGGGAGAGAAPEFELEVALDSLSHGRLGFGAAAAAARGRRDSLTWFARSRIGDVGAFLGGGRFTRRVGTGAHSGKQAAVVGVDSFAVLLPGGVWALEAPAELLVSDSDASISRLTLKSVAGPGRLVLEGDLPTPGRANAHLQLEGFPLAGVYALLEHDTLGVGGTLTATVGLSGTRVEPVYTGSLALNDAAFGDFRAPFVDGTWDYRDRRLNAALHLWRSGQQILSVTAHLPLDLALTAVAQRELPDTLSVQARADSVDLSVLEALTPVLRQVQGEISADGGIGGTWDDPILRGSLRLDGAAATIPALNVRYEQLNGRLAFSGDTIRFDSLSARSDKGSVEVSGFVRLERLTRPVFALEIAAHEFKALDLRGNLSVTASGQLSLTGPVLGATLTGRGTVTSGVLYFADLVNKRIVNLEDPLLVTVIDTTISTLIRRQRLGPELQSVFIDSLRVQGLQLAMGSDVWLRSTEANIQLTGTLAVDKERSSYRLSGTLQAPRGTYRLVLGPVTREFVVSQGTVRYFGTPDLNAELDIEAKHVVHPVSGAGQRNPESITIVARIRGTLLVPRLTLEAERRDLSQTEIISYLLFGQPSFELAGQQAGFADKSAVLRSAVAGILSGELERTLVSDLGVPLDYVEIRPGNPADPFSGAQVAAGWQIGRKTFLVLNAGFCEVRQLGVGNIFGASLQFRISPEWRTEASFEPVRTCGSLLTEQQSAGVPYQIGLNLFWEKRY